MAELCFFVFVFVFLSTEDSTQSLCTELQGILVFKHLFDYVFIGTSETAMTFLKVFT